MRRSAPYQSTVISICRHHHHWMREKQNKILRISYKDTHFGLRPNRVFFAFFNQAFINNTQFPLLVQLITTLHICHLDFIAFYNDIATQECEKQQEQSRENNYYTEIITDISRH